MVSLLYNPMTMCENCSFCTPLVTMLYSAVLKERNLSLLTSLLFVFLVTAFSGREVVSRWL